MRYVIDASVTLAWFLEGVDAPHTDAVLTMTPNISMRAERFVLRGLTGYDSVYAALAEELKGKWLTLDKKAHGMIEDENLSVNLYDALPPDF